jgi:hypothetical protein
MKHQKEIEKLIEERDRYKLLWESACEGAKAIIAELEYEIKLFKKSLKNKC